MGLWVRPPPGSLDDADAEVARAEAEVAKADLDRRRAAAARLHGEEAASSKPGRRGGVREEE